MKIEDKIKLLSGKDVWHTADIPNENIPSIMMADGPSGLRKQVDTSDNLGLNSSYQATSFPAPAAVACSFNKEMAQLMGEAIGKEARANNVHIVLGPGINIKRNPLCGRNFEYYSEDPYLSGIMGYHWITGLQSNNVGASLKHFAANNQETFRFTSDSWVDERALREIYLKNFEIAIKANPATVMCSYNKLNGTYASHSKYLLSDILRKKWQYDGLVVSDWGAVSDRVLGVKHGLDLEMPSSYGYHEHKIKEALMNGELTEEEINQATNRVIKLVRKYQDNKQISFNKQLHHEIASKIASESIVLLKNDYVLPLKLNEKIAIVGAFAQSPRYQGGGSSFINPFKVENVLDEINNYTKNYHYYPGYYLDEKPNDDLIQDIVQEVHEYDKIIIMTGLPESYETEGVDRKNLDLPLSHLRLIDEISRVNPNVIINLYTGAQVAMPFQDQVKGIINCHLLGAASAKPLLDILFGKVSPSGRLATTYPIRLNDDITSVNFADGNNAIYYEESIYVGYRYYTTFKKDVLYPFGYGLSYSEFTYSDLLIDHDVISKDHSIIVKCKVKNIGKYPAKEVVQLYIENNKSLVYKPLRELRRFEKVDLEINEEKEIVFELKYDDFAYYDIYMNKYHVDQGVYKIQVCKHANEVIMEKEVVRQENDIDFQPHPWTRYSEKEYQITKQDFEQLFKNKLPEKNIIHKRPYTMDNTLLDVKNTLVGKMMYKIALKEAMKLNKDASSEWMREAISKTVASTPLRTLATMSAGYISLKKMEGILDIINLKLIRGLRKL